MRPFIVFLLTGIFSFVAGIFLPWWSLALVAFLIALILRQSPFISFLSAFLALFLFWFSYSYFIDLSNDHILASRMSQVILNKEAPLLMCVISGGIAGLIAGFAALSASLLRKKEKTKVHKGLAYNYQGRG